MTEPSNNTSPKVPPFLPPEPPTHPRPNGKNKRVSQRGLLSLAMTVISVFSLLVMMTGWLKLSLDIFDLGLTAMLDGIWAKIIALALAFLFGWLTAVLSIRVFGNLVLPMIISGLAWVVLAGVSILYIAIISRLYVQAYTNERFVGYMLMMAAGILVLVGLHLIDDDHDLRPHAVPLLVIAMGQLFVIVYRYVFTTDANSALLINDILFFVAMIVTAGLMVAHVGILAPVRNLITRLFDQNSHNLRPDN